MAFDLGDEAGLAALVDLLNAQLSEIERLSFGFIEKGGVDPKDLERRQTLFALVAEAGRKLLAHGGLPAAHAVVRKLGNLSATRRDMLEDAWKAIPGYKKVSFLP
jgi:hypothetical protein